MSDHPDQSIWLATGSRANAKAVYRMLGNDKVSKELVLSAHRDASGERGQGQVLLAIQDTMAANYSTHTKTAGLGYNCEQSLGVNVHSCVMITPDGIPLGLLSQSVITREKKAASGKTREERRARPIEEKESYRWLQTMQTAAQNAPPQAKLIHIADREGDIYELFAMAEHIGESFIIRAVYDRLDVNNTHVLERIRESRVIGKAISTIPENHKHNHKEREAVLTIQCEQVNIQRPKIRRNDRELERALALRMIRVREERPVEGIAPIEWILVTNLTIENANDALEAVEHYKQRWKIERFHYVLKSGCKIEEIQQRSVDRIEIMILLYSIISIHIMQLTFLARDAPETPCDLIFSEKEWKTLYRAGNKTRWEPERPPSMEEAVRLVAKLGGRVAAKSDGPPGLKVVWIGLSNLFTLVNYRDFL